MERREEIKLQFKKRRGGGGLEIKKDKISKRARGALIVGGGGHIDVDLCEILYDYVDFEVS